MTPASSPNEAEIPFSRLTTRGQNQKLLLHSTDSPTTYVEKSKASNFKKNYNTVLELGVWVPASFCDPQHSRCSERVSRFSLFYIQVPRYFEITR